MNIDEIIIQFACDDMLDQNILQYLEQLVEPLPEVANILFGRRGERQRNEEYFEIIIPRYTDHQFKEHFRMNRNTFEMLLNEVCHHLEDRNQPNVHMPLEKKLLFTIWLLSKQESFLAVGDRFNIPPSSGHGIFKFIIKTLEQLMPLHIRWPNNTQQSVTSQIFEGRSQGISNVVGAIDGCHIPIKQPPGNANDFYNRKQFHSIILQGICDHTCSFIDVYIGMPGRIHDARVFRYSPIFKRINDRPNPLLSREKHLIGDCAYPLTLNVMTPFRDNGHLSASQTRYNVRLSSIRSVIERAFGRLKSKFRRLKLLDTSSPRFSNQIIAAACMLHNFILKNEAVDENEVWDEHNIPAASVQEAGDANNRAMYLEAVQKRIDIMNSL